MLQNDINSKNNIHVYTEVDSFDRIQKRYQRIGTRQVLRIQEGLRNRSLNKVARDLIDIIFH